MMKRMTMWLPLWFGLLCWLPAGTARAGEAGAEARVRLLQQAAVSGSAVREGSGGMKARLHLAALLPHVSVSAGRGLSVTGNERQVNGVAQLTLTDGDRVNYSVSARWDLSRVLYAREELSMRTQEQRAAHQRAAVTAEVARLYYERRRLLRSAADADRIAELTATLDGLTGLRGLAALSPEDLP